jgi:copper(I)-binding protein
MRLWAIVCFGAALALVVVGCGSGDEPSVAAPKVAVTDAWTTPGSGYAAVYVTITNDGDADRLVKVSAAGVGSVLLMGADGDVAHTSAAGAVAVDLDVPHGTTTLQPGTQHLMLTDLAAPLEPGDTVPLHLTFESAGAVSTTVEVRASGATP